MDFVTGVNIILRFRKPYLIYVISEFGYMKVERNAWVDMLLLASDRRYGYRLKN
jgi:hypothetical protein